MRTKKILLLFLSIFISHLAFAKGSTSASHATLSMMEAKTKLEESLTQRLQSMISTTLDKETYQVSVQVELIPTPVQQEDKKAESKFQDVVEKPLDLTVGLVDAEAVIQKYQEEVQSLKDRQALWMSNVAVNANSQPEFLVKSVHVMVGISSEFGDEYSKELQKWLSDKLAPDFGSALTVQVSLIKPAPDTKEKPKSFLDYLLKFQSLLGYLLLFGGAIVGILMMKLMGSKDASEQRKLTAQLQQNMRTVEALGEAAPSLPVADEIEALSEPHARDYSQEIGVLQDLERKIMWSAQENLTELPKMFYGWLEMGEKGFFKTACMLDAMIALGGKKENLSLQWEATIPDEFKKNMRETFEKMSTLTIQEKIKILEDVYWDLVSLKTLGSTYLVAPFQYVSALPVREVRAILEAQNPRVRALAALYMPDEVQSEYLRVLPLEKKMEILEQSLQMDKVLSTDVETASETFKFEVRKTTTDAKAISIKSMVPKLLESMSVFDEISLLKDISQRISDGGLAIKQSFPSLAFIAEWPEAKARPIFSNATSDEVLTLVRLVPEAKDIILKMCAPRVQTIVNDDFGREDQNNAETKEKHLSALKLRMLKVINKEKIHLDEIFPSASAGGLRVAS